MHQKTRWRADAQTCGEMQDGRRLRVNDGWATDIAMMRSLGRILREFSK